MVLLGATAVEDKLQEDVPSTIADLQRGGIKVWMLTGDKFETAENIGFSCKLLKEDFHIYRINDLESMNEICSLPTLEQNDQKLKKGEKRGLIVEGSWLLAILNDPVKKAYFLSLSKTCTAVICCRVSPS